MGNGRIVRFWLDYWVGDGILGDASSAPVPDDEMDAKIEDYTDEAGNWLWYKFEHLLPTSIIDQIRAIHSFKERGIDDAPCWKFSSDGKFNMKYAYAIATDLSPVLQDKSWIPLWKCNCPPKVKTLFVVS